MGSGGRRVITPLRPLTIAKEATGTFQSSNVCLAKVFIVSACASGIM